MNLKHLLSDQFVEFSSKVTDVHGRIKELKTKFQADLKALNQEAEELNTNFQAWQKDQEKDPVQILQAATKDAATKNTPAR